MYHFVTHTWNPIRGRCEHKCPYCYIRRMPHYKYKDTEPDLILEELNINLGKDKFIFIGSATDMWGHWIPGPWIQAVIDRIFEFPENKYLFQTKCPLRYSRFIKEHGAFPEGTILGTTIESNRDHGRLYMGDTISVIDRADDMYDLRRNEGYENLMVTIEPIMEFDLIPFVEMIREINPKYVAIGADSGSNNLPEPCSSSIHDLVTEISKDTIIILKDNLKRLYKEMDSDK